MSTLLFFTRKFSAVFLILTISHFHLFSIGADKAEALQDSSVVLFHATLNDNSPAPALLLNNVTCRYTSDGLNITGTNGLVRIDKYYSLNERIISYRFTLSGDAKAVFQSDQGDFIVYIDALEKSCSVQTTPVTSKKIDFIKPETEYLLEIHRNHQTSIVRITEILTGRTDEIKVTNDGMGGCGVGAINVGFNVGRQYDYYCFGLVRGTSLMIKEIRVITSSSDLKLLIYGDSITETEGYYPTKDYSKSWTQLIKKSVKGKILCSGRGGCTIDHVLERIKNELPFLKAKYVMVTIGTNGGNTEEKLDELIEFIKAQGSIPILNNIPCNESATQKEFNHLISIVRKKHQINGCLFDLATSINQDGKEVDKTTMYHEDYSATNGLQIYHHPNIKGSQLMFNRTLIDLPEIYK